MIGVEVRDSSIGQLTAEVYSPQGDIYFGDGSRSPANFVRMFPVRSGAIVKDFVGRERVFDELGLFRRQHPFGFFEIVADGGLGKTALAAEISRRYDAISFFADVSTGVREARQFLTHMASELILRYNLKYTQLPPRAGEDSTFLSEVMARAAASTGNRPVWLVVDGLDEAEKPHPRANPLLIPTYPPHGVYVVITRRPTTDRLITAPNTPHHILRIEHDSLEQTSDVSAFLWHASRNSIIQDKLARANPPVPADVFVSRLSEASLGNFRFVEYVLDDLAAAEPDASLRLESLPRGLEEYYARLWNDAREELTDDIDTWKRLHRPVIERLAVAAEPVTVKWLADQLGLDPDEIDLGALRLWKRVLRRVPRDGMDDVWHVEHRSFTDFLETRVDLPSTHRAIAEWYIDQFAGQWKNCDEYGLRHALIHMVESADPSLSPIEYHELARLAQALALDESFQREYLTRFGDPTALDHALMRVLEIISSDVRAEPLDAARVAIEAVTLRREMARAQPIFDLARRGEVERAERRLDLFYLELDSNWYNALLLIVAWLAADHDPSKARTLRDRVAKEHGAYGSLKILLERVNSSLDGTSLPSVSLPSPPSAAEAEVMVARLGSAALDISMLSGAQIELLNRQNQSEPIGDDGAFLAAENGPALVAFAAADPPAGGKLLARYVALHSSYGYAQYRKGSLWELLASVLRHPNQEWIRQWVTALGESALSPNRGGFHGALEYAVRAMQVAAGVPGASGDLEMARAEALSEARWLFPAESDVQARGDTWGLTRRRLAALAEAYSRLPDKLLETGELMRLAVQLPFGYAGFNALACLAMTEAIEVANGGHEFREKSLAAARESAHNIQDPVFCARTTARFNALSERWWSSEFDVLDTSSRLRQDPGAPEFAALHIVGESYRYRHPLTSVPLPNRMRDPNTIAGLSWVYQRSDDALIRLNPELGSDPHRPLDPGTPVNIPDPGLPALLAARFAARALADPSLTDQDRIAAIRQVLPTAVNNPTALDVVLARLVLAEHKHDPAMLDALAHLAETNAQSAAAAEQGLADTAMGFPS